MQFSLDKFFEMMEARFGKRATNALLAVLGLALFIFALNAIITYGVAPLYLLVVDLLRGARITIGLSDVLAFLFATIAPGVSTFLVYELVIRRMMRNTGEWVASHETKAGLLLEQVEAIYVADKEKVDLLRQAQEVTEKLMGESQEDIRKLYQEAIQEYRQEVRGFVMRMEEFEDRLSMLEKAGQPRVAEWDLGNNGKLGEEGLIEQPTDLLGNEG